MAFVDRGNLVEIDSPNELYENPKNEITARFMGVENLFYITRKDQNVSFCDLKINIPGPDEDGWLIMRPEIFSLSDEGRIRGTVEELTIRQGETWLRVKLVDNSIVAKLPYSVSRTVSEGDRVNLKIDIDEIRFIPDDRHN